MFGVYTIIIHAPTHFSPYSFLQCDTYEHNFQYDYQPFRKTIRESVSTWHDKSVRIIYMYRKMNYGLQVNLLLTRLI